MEQRLSCYYLEWYQKNNVLYIERENIVKNLKIILQTKNLNELKKFIEFLEEDKNSQDGYWWMIGN